MNILYVSYDGMTDPLGRSQVIPYLEGLSRAGHHICIMSCEKEERFGKFKDIIHQQLEKASIKWVPLKYSRRPPVLSTILDIFKMRRSARRLHHEYSFDLIHCRSYIAAFIGLMMKRTFGCSFLFDMRGFWADERVDGGIWNLKNPVFKIVYRYFKKMERRFLLEADRVISLTHNAKAEMCGWDFFKNKGAKVQVIPCCCDMELFDRTKTARATEMLRSELLIEDSDMVVSYLGSIGTWYLTDDMIRFFAAFKKSIRQSRFLFITQDHKKDITDRCIEAGIPEKDVFVIAAGRDQVPALLGLSSISVFFVKPVWSKKASSPTKMGEIMSMGIPLICNKGVGDVDDIISKSCVGAVIEEFSEAEYQQVIDRLELLMHIDSAYIREQASRFYSMETGTELYKQVYQSIEESRKR